MAELTPMLAEKSDTCQKSEHESVDETVRAPVKLVRTFRTRAYLSKSGHIRFDEVLAQQALLYNAALEERSSAWKYGENHITYKSQSRELTAVRRDFPDIEGALDRRVQIGTLKRIDRAFQAFFRRISAGETPGYPRFKSRNRWRTLELYSGANRYVHYDAETGKGHIKIKGLPVMRFKDKRMPEGIQPLELRISRRPNGVYLYMVFDHLRGKPQTESHTNPVGINAGLSGVRWGLSDGTLIDRRRTDAADRRKRRLQRKISRQKRGSNSRRKTVELLSKHANREKIRNRNELHRISADLVRRYDFIAVEDLDIHRLTASARGTIEEPGENVALKAGWNRSMLTQTWGEFAQMLQYKAEGAGIGFVRVDPAYTSLTCSGCGAVRQDMSEAERMRLRFRCSSCGADIYRTVNAARNILARGLAAPVPSAGEPQAAGRAKMEDLRSAVADLRPENHTRNRGDDTAPT